MKTYDIPPLEELEKRRIQQKETCIVLTLEDMHLLRDFFSRAWKKYPNLIVMFQKCPDRGEDVRLFIATAPTLARLLEVPHENDFEGEFKEAIVACINAPRTESPLSKVIAAIPEDQMDWSPLSLARMKENLDQLLGIEFSKEVIEYVGEEWWAKNQRYLAIKARAHDSPDSATGAADVQIKLD